MHWGLKNADPITGQKNLCNPFSLVLMIALALEFVSCACVYVCVDPVEYLISLVFF